MSYDLAQQIDQLRRRRVAEMKRPPRSPFPALALALALIVAGAALGFFVSMLGGLP